MSEGRNYIVARATPDWMRFDLNDTRAFCAAIGLPEMLIIDFAARWDAVMAMSFLEYRAAMKAISVGLMEDVRCATIVPAEDIETLSVDADDILYFTDDDDWVRHDIFERLRAQRPSEHGWVWSSPAMAKMFGEPPPELDGSLVIHDRPVDHKVHTNNYAVTGGGWRALGYAKLFEHFWAQVASDRGEFRPVRITEPLSAAHKHMCCTTAIHRNTGIPEVLNDLKGALGAYQDHIGRTVLTPRLDWLAAPMRAVMAVNARALGARSGAG